MCLCACVCVIERGRESICMCVTGQTAPLFSCLLSSLDAVVTNYLFLAVIVAHRYTAFPTPTTDFTILVTWADLTPLSLLLAPAFFLWLRCGFCYPTHHPIASMIGVCNWGQSSKRLLMCGVTSSFESSFRKSLHAMVIRLLNSGC